MTRRWQAPAAARAHAAAALAAALALSVGACGGGTNGGEPAAGGSAPGGPAATATRPDPSRTGPGSEAPSPRPDGTTAARSPAAEGPGAAPDLEAVALRNGDLAEFRIADVPPLRTEPPGDVAPAACRVVADVRREAYEPRPTAIVRRYAIATGGEHLGTGTQVSLAATTEAGARAVLAALRDAVRACAGGYTGDGRGTTAVKADTPVDVGDEAVAFTTTGRGTPTAYTLVRQGSVLVRFAASSGSGGEPRTPLPVVVQQVMKLRAATD
ncbi:sensor domain-containing protein [Streptomyces thermolilacinus]|uniref:Uncharacterized protein n=1 Tax=Streptomyces thermolilacinus SPC6 TaxID=1306406 RepID=A0A1D3DM33_9ACTN|nr:sensor domain-containing protein [Streptomyces thermolilacinus]OEJ93351.1 hypothetical protein J116_001560 [Streptomyces thermolilacinus SPC6]